jgi:hypothetical protein
MLSGRAKAERQHLAQHCGEAGCGSPDERDQGDRAPAGEPLQLLAALTRRPPPAQHLVGDERQPDGQDRDQDDSLDPVAGRVTLGDDVTGAVEPDVVTGDGGDRLGQGGRRRPGHQPRVGPEHPAPPGRGQPPVREQQDDDREERHQGRGRRGQRETVVTGAIAVHRVVTGVAADHGQEHEADQGPGHGVTRLAPGDDHPDPGVAEEDRDSGPGAEERELVGQVSQDHAEGGQDHRGHPEQGGRRG